MNKFLLLVFGLFLFAPTTAHAKDPCRSIQVKEDKFGGGSSAVAVVQTLNDFHMVGLFLKAQSGEVTLNLTVKEGGALNGIVAAGTEMKFVFADGQVLSLTTARDAALQSYINGGIVKTNVPYTFVLSPEQLKIFSGTPISAVRLPIISQGTTMDWEANKGVQSKLNTMAGCLAKL